MDTQYRPRVFYSRRLDMQKNNADWSDAELEATVAAYLKMLNLEQSGQTFKKSVENRLLREGPLSLRSASSIEFRMQNISAVFEQLGLRRITGYTPAKNNGAGVSERIREAAARLNSFGLLGLGPEWVEKQKSSFLYGYLTSHTPETIRAAKKLRFESDKLEFYVDTPHEIPVIQPELEKEIVEVIKRGGNISELSKEAYKYFSVFWAFFWDTLQKVLNSIALMALITTLQSTTEASRTPKEVRHTVKSFSPEQRMFLVGNSVVTGDEVILRTEPNKKSAELGRLIKGTWVENLKGDTSAWVHVRAVIDGEDVEGWIYRSYLVRL